MKCEYKLDIPDKPTLCNYYFENVKIHGRTYAHFPECDVKDCPLLKMEEEAERCFGE